MARMAAASASVTTNIFEAWTNRVFRTSATFRRTRRPSSYITEPIASSGAPGRR
jgi:hypothetical protein